MKGILILNTDFGISKSIGARALPIAKNFPKRENLIIYCRDFNKYLDNKFNIIRVLPFGKFIMQSLTAIPIYISNKIDLNPIKNCIFDYFMLTKIKKLNLNEIDFIHSWDFLPKTFKYIKETNPNIMIFADVPIGFPSILKKLKKWKIYWTEKELETKNYVYNSLEYIDYFISPSDFVRDSLVNENIKENRIFVVPFGVDSNKYRPKKKKLNTINFAFSGNTNNRKGIPYLVEAFRELNLKDAKLNIYGRIYPEISKYRKKSQLNNIFFHGFTDLKKELPKNHVFVFPTLLEGSAKSVYEAMACGMPIITTRNAGSIVRNGKDGFIIETENKEAIKEKILYFYNNRKEIEKMGKNARKHVEKYTWDRYGKEINKIYNKIK